MSNMMEHVRDRIKSCYDKECGELGTTMDEDTARWLARAAIEALREPTDAMREAGTKVDVGHSWGSGTPAAPMGEYCYMPENVWAAMLGAVEK